MSQTITHLPVYQQLSNALTSYIVRGNMPAGSKFLTEREICKRYNVSRPTANKVLAGLVSEGTLEFRKGIGTFIAPKSIQYDLRSLISFTEKARAAGKIPSTDIVDFRRCSVEDIDPSIAERLNLYPPQKVFYITRLRRADNIPVILERRWTVADFCPGLTEKEVNGSIYELWTKKYGLNISGAEETIHAVNLGEPDAQLLEVAGQSAALLVRSVGYVDGEHPLWYEQTLYRGESYEFHNRLGPVKSSGIQGRLA
jgi:GntR family transcriptional regulator